MAGCDVANPVLSAEIGGLSVCPCVWVRLGGRGVAFLGVAGREVWACSCPRARASAISYLACGDGVHVDVGEGRDSNGESGGLKKML